MSLDPCNSSAALQVSENSTHVLEQSERMDLLSVNFVSLELRETSEDNNFMDQEIVDERIEEIYHSTDSMLLEKKTSLQTDKRRFRRKTSLERENLNSNEKSLGIISLDELAWHDTADDCWVAIYDYVYDCTDFVKSHPGGQDVLLEYAGRDATLAFIGTGHSMAARNILEKYLIGELPAHERIFRIIDGVKIVEQQ